MSTTASAYPLASSDEAAVRGIVTRLAEAWGRHDMRAFVADMAPDVDWINVVGMHWQGRDTVERAHTAFHRLPLFANSRMVPGDLDLRQLAPEVILGVEHSRIEGAGPTPGGGTYPADGAIMTLVFVKTDDGWRIAHGHNTNINAQAVANDPAKR